MRVSFDGALALWVLTGSALNLDTARALHRAATEVAVADVGAVLLTAEGPNFCVGGDLREFAASADPSAHVRAVATEVHAALRILTELPVPVVTAVRGAVAGGGVGLALAGDIVIAARDTRFRLAYTAGGLSPDCGASWVLPRLIGLPRALQLALANPVVTAETALSMGLVSLVVDDPLESVARTLARQLADGPREAQAATKRLLRSAYDSTYAEHLDREADSIAHLAGTPDGREGVQAFVEKHPARFSAHP